MRLNRPISNHTASFRLRWALVVSGLIVAQITTVCAASPDYLLQIKPLLARHCVPCHGATVQKGSLRLDTAAHGVQGGSLGTAWKNGDPSASLILQVILGQHPDVARMPYKRPPLDSDEIQVIRDWITSGAKFPDREEPSSDKHWAFIAPKRPALPPLKNRSTASANPIDAFVQSRLERENIQPSPEADRAVLYRRVALDLTGLAPAPEEIESFLQDQRPGAYERRVEALLRSPRYGERWGRWWLDQARYADSNGYSIDSPREIWPYRDWVIAALNRDMPFDQFTVWQIAGDLLPKVSDQGWQEALEPLIATGFHRNTQVNHEGGIDQEQFRIESVMDRVNTTATVWLGLTLSCAQCHDHKFDPLTQRDYYRFFAFFNGCENDGHGNAALEAENHLELSPPEIIAQRNTHRAEAQRREKEVEEWANTELKPRQSKWELSIVSDPAAKVTPIVRELVHIPADKRGTDQVALVWRAFRDQDTEYLRRKKEADRFKSSTPPVIRTLVMRERPAPRDTTVYIKGDFTRPGEKVQPATPEVLQSRAANQERSAGLTRLDLARWIVSTDNPLTARVLVNKLWQQFFGRGIVETENDFGIQGAPPTHPELLDWLAVECMEQGWSLKHMHRLIVTSATYKQSSKTRPDLAERDPSNRLWARQVRMRLDAELIRDTQLRASGLLSHQIGGAPVFPPQAAGLGAFTQNDRPWKTSQGAGRYRRSVYTHLQRTSLHPSLTVFDGADGYQPCTRRLRSNTPLQALTLLNDPACFEFAKALAERLIRAFPSGPDRSRLDLGFQRCAGRMPTEFEANRIQALVEAERASGTGSEAETWTQVCRVLLNLDETITRE